MKPQILTPRRIITSGLLVCVLGFAAYGAGGNDPGQNSPVAPPSVAAPSPSVSFDIGTAIATVRP